MTIIGHCEKHPTAKLQCTKCLAAQGGRALNRTMSPERRAALKRASHARPAYIAKQKRIQDALEEWARKRAKS